MQQASTRRLSRLSTHWAARGEAIRRGAPALRIELEEDPVFTGEVIVAATRADERTPMTYATLNREELATNNLGQDVPYLLQWTPSTVVTSDAGTGIGYTGGNPLMKSDKTLYNSPKIL